MKGLDRNLVIRSYVLAMVMSIMGATILAIVLTDRDMVTQTGTFPIQTINDDFHIPLDIVITVHAPRTFYVNEGRDEVDIRIERVGPLNMTSFQLHTVIGYLGTMEGLRFVPFATDHHVFNENGTVFETTLSFDPRMALKEAKIAFELSVEMYFEQSPSVHVGGLTTQPVFGPFEVQDRIALFLLFATPMVIGSSAVVLYLRSRFR